MYLSFHHEQRSPHLFIYSILSSIFSANLVPITQGFLGNIIAPTYSAGQDALTGLLEVSFSCLEHFQMVLDKKVTSSHTNVVIEHSFLLTELNLGRKLTLLAQNNAVILLANAS